MPGFAGPQYPSAPGELELYITNKSGVRTAPLPQAIINSVSWELNEVATMNFSMEPSAPGASQALLKNSLEYQLWIDDVLLWMGYGIHRSGNSSLVTWDCEDPMGYLHHRHVLEENLVYTAIDQIDIASALVTYSQAAIQGTNPGLNILIAGYSASGITRTRTYNSDRKHNLFDAVKEFSTLEEGFDSDLVLSTGGSRFWTPYYPQKGSLKSTTLEYGANMVDYSWDESAINLATKVDATGGTASADPLNPLSTRTKQSVRYEDTAASTRHGVHSTVLPSGARSDIPWLTARATRAVDLRKDPVVITTATCRQGGDYPVLLGNLVTGDTCKIVVQDGTINVNQVSRIKKVTWVPASNRVKYEFTDVTAS